MTSVVLQGVALHVWQERPYGLHFRAVALLYIQYKVGLYVPVLASGLKMYVQYTGQC